MGGGGEIGEGELAAGEIAARLGQRVEESEPAAQGMADVWIPFRSAETGQDVRLHGLWLPQPRADAPLLLYLHGARWDVRGSAHRMRRMHELGFAVLGVDYRGFGQSSPGLPSETLAHEDAQAAWDWLATQYPDRDRYIFGHSLGGAIAVRLASTRPHVKGLIVEGSFTSIPDLVKHFKWGWLAIFFYVGSEVTIGSILINYLADEGVMGMSEDSSAKYLSFYWGGTMIGRLMGAISLSKIQQSRKYTFMVLAAAGATAVIYANATFKENLTHGHHIEFQTILPYICMVVMGFVFFIICFNQSHT